MPTSPTASNVLAYILPVQQPPPYPSDIEWEALVANDTVVNVARYLARMLRVRSPVGVSTWSMDRLRQHYSPLILERWRAYSPARAGAYPVDNWRAGLLPWVGCPLLPRVPAKPQEFQR